MPELVTLGESMLVMRPNQPGPLRYAHQFTRSVGGAESNVAIGMCRLGHSTGWISRLGDDEIGHYILNTIRGEGVDVSHVQMDPHHRNGLYFKELAVMGDPQLIYYRANSAASRLKPTDLDEGYIKNARMLHVTGITPALSESARETAFAALEIARSAGVTVSFDPNMRYKLWTADEARPVLMDMARKADVVLPGLSEGEMLLGFSDAEEVARGFMQLGARAVAVKLGSQGALVATDDEMHHIDPLPVTPVDTVGAGDAFDAAFLSGYLENRPLAESGRRACIAGALTTLVHGDWEGMASKEKIETFLSGTSTISR